VNRFPTLRAALRAALSPGQAAIRGPSLVRGKWNDDREKQRSKVALNFVG
jgi:hypothetical protein